VRVAFIGVSHWHTAHYLKGLDRAEDVTLVGVADPDPEVAQRYADGSSTTGFTDYRAMCEQTRPDVVFALGRHVDMAAEAEFLIEAGIPFAIEKPCGVNVREVERLASLARDHAAFAAVPFTYRMSRFRQLIREFSGSKELTYGLFRQIPGPVARYRQDNVEWNLDRATAGGGCTLNLSIHFFDLLRVLAPSAPWQVSGATMSNALTGVDVEDFSATLLESGGRRASVETGYIFPSRPGELLLSVCVEGDYYVWDGRKGQITMTLLEGREETFPERSSQSAYYPDFLVDTIRRVRENEPPDADLGDMVQAARLAESAYRHAGDTIAMSS
jgi:predicted dehydrogenase